MKCLIADDEYLVRFTLQDMLEDLADQGKFMFESITQVSHGSELLRLLPEVKPDVVFVDIRMPDLNGLEAMEKGILLSPSTQWIILTGYSEFDYARKAISLNAIAYLLKPASPIELERALSLAETKLVDSKAVKQVQLEHKLYGVLQDTYTEDSDENINESQQMWFSGFILSIDSFASIDKTIQLRRDFIKDLRQWSVDERISRSTVGIVMLDDGNFAVVLSSPSSQDAQMMLNRILAHTGEMSSTREQLRCTFFLLKEEEKSFTQVITALLELSKGSWIRLFQGFGSSITQQVQQRTIKKFQAVEQFLTTLERLLKNREFESINAIQLIRKHRDVFIELWNEEGFRSFVTFLSNRAVRVEEPSEAADSCIAWLESCVMESDEVLGLRMQRTVKKALELIQDHVNEEIGLAQIADSIGVTPNYLSTIFNKVVGETFPQYVTKLRMEKAVILLREESMTVKEVATQVGYVSCRHFSKVFKKYNGHTPSEYVLLRSNLRNWYQIQRN